MASLYSVGLSYRRKYCQPSPVLELGPSGTAGFSWSSNWQPALKGAEITLQTYPVYGFPHHHSFYLLLIDTNNRMAEYSFDNSLDSVELDIIQCCDYEAKIVFKLGLTLKIMDFLLLGEA